MNHAGCDAYLKSIRYLDPAARMMIKAGFGGFALVKKVALLHYTTDVGLLDDSATPEKYFAGGMKNRLSLLSKSWKRFIWNSRKGTSGATNVRLSRSVKHGTWSFALGTGILGLSALLGRNMANTGSGFFSIFFPAMRGRYKRWPGLFSRLVLMRCWIAKLGAKSSFKEEDKEW